MPNGSKIHQATTFDRFSEYLNVKKYSEKLLLLDVNRIDRINRSIFAGDPTGTLVRFAPRTGSNP